MPDNEVAAPDFERLREEDSSETIEIDSSAAHLQASIVLARNAARRIRILSRHLDPPVYDDPLFVDAVKGFVLNNRRASVRVLIQDPAPLRGIHHRFVSFSQRVTSFIELRVPGREHSRYLSAFMVVDDRGVIFRNFAIRYEGIVNFNDMHQANALIRIFDDMWEMSKSDMGLRRLGI